MARRNADKYCQQRLGYAASNMRFVEGHIEFLDKAGIADESLDLVISNCVVNLSPDKPRVLQQAYRVLAPGGEMYFSDVYCDRRLPDIIRKNEVCKSLCASFSTVGAALAKNAARILVHLKKSRRFRAHN